MQSIQGTLVLGYTQGTLVLGYTQGAKHMTECSWELFFMFE